jgi:hypothetical protein
MIERPLHALDFLKFAGITVFGIGGQAIVLSLPVDVAFEHWLFLCAGGLLWARIFDTRGITL